MVSLKDETLEGFSKKLNNVVVSLMAYEKTHSNHHAFLLSCDGQSSTTVIQLVVVTLVSMWFAELFDITHLTASLMSFCCFGPLDILTLLSTALVQLTYRHLASSSHSFG